MIFNLKDKFVLAGIECEVALVDAHGRAYLKPDTSGDEYNNSHTLIGVVFAVIDEDGRDSLGNKVQSISNVECGAV